MAEIKDEVKIGGEDLDRKILPTLNDDGTPAFYLVKIKSFRKKPGRPNDAGEETFYYSWLFEVQSLKYQGTVVFGTTNDEARLSYTTKKPMRLLQLIQAANGGVAPKKGEVVKLADLVGKTLRIQLEEKTGLDGEIFQTAGSFYPAKTAKVEPEVEGLPTEEESAGEDVGF